MAQNSGRELRSAPDCYYRWFVNISFLGGGYGVGKGKGAELLHILCEGFLCED